MSHARRATNAQPQVASNYPQQPQHMASGYPAPYGAPQGYGYPQQQQQYPQQGYPQQQYPQQGYPQQQYPQQHGYPQQSGYPQPYPQHASSYPAPQQYPQQGYPQQSGYPQPYAQAPQMMPQEEVLESGVHPADLEGRTIVRPSFGAHPPVAKAAPAPAPAGNASHNDTVIAVSPFADPFAAARLQKKSDPPPADLAETCVQTNGNAARSNLAYAPTAAHPMMTADAQTYGYAPSVAPQAPAPQPQQPAPAARTSVPSPRPGSISVQPKPEPKAEPKAAAQVSKPAAEGPGLRLGVRGVGSVDLSKMNQHAGRFGSGMVPVLGIAAVVVATLFDVLFLKLPIGGSFIGKLWYFTTAISFAAFGYGSALMTRAGKGMVITTAIVVAVLYGAADIGVEAVLEGATVGSALFLAIQGVVIALVVGIGASLKGFAQRP